MRAHLPLPMRDDASLADLRGIIAAVSNVPPEHMAIWLADNALQEGPLQPQGGGVCGAIAGGGGCNEGRAMGGPCEHA